MTMMALLSYHTEQDNYHLLLKTELTIINNSYVAMTLFIYIFQNYSKHISVLSVPYCYHNNIMM